MVGPYYKQDSMYYKTQDQMIGEFEAYMSEGEDRSFRLPKHKEVCEQCRGNGTMVNRSVDGQGLSPNDADLDDEFWEDYHSGVYDVICDECKGRNVVDVVDYDSLSPEVKREWDDWVQSHDEMVAENLAEMRAGC